MPRPLQIGVKALSKALCETVMREHASPDAVFFVIQKRPDEALISDRAHRLAVITVTNSSRSKLILVEPQVLLLSGRMFQAFRCPIFNPESVPLRSFGPWLKN